MKLELPDNNASVLFHMGNALQSIAYDLNPEQVNMSASHVHDSANNQQVIKGLEISDIVAAVKASLDEAVELGLIDETELSESIDDMTNAIAAEHEIPANRLHGENDVTVEVSDTIDADGLPWDQRINSKGRTRIKGNVWRARQKPNDKSDEEWAEYVESVKTELRALMAIPVTVTYDPNEADPFAIEPPVVDAVVTPPVVDAVVTPPVVDTVVTPPVVDTVVTPPVDATVIAPPVVDAAVTGPTTFPELMKFITVNNKKLTKESVDEALKAQGLASIALLAARTDLIPQIHAALVKLL